MCCDSKRRGNRPAYAHRRYGESSCFFPQDALVAVSARWLYLVRTVSSLRGRRPSNLAYAVARWLRVASITTLRVSRRVCAYWPTGRHTVELVSICKRRNSLTKRYGATRSRAFA